MIFILTASLTDGIHEFCCSSAHTNQPTYALVPIKVTYNAGLYVVGNNKFNYKYQTVQ